MQSPPVSGLFEVVTREPHNRVAGDVVVFQGVRQPGGGIHPYNGWFLVDSVSGSPAYTMVCRIFDVPGTVLAPTLNSAAMGVDYHGPVVHSGSGGVAEGNAVYDCLNPAYNDTGSTRDLVFRYNYYSDVYTGFNQNLTFVTKARNLLASGGVMLIGPLTVEVDTSGSTESDHHLAEGDIVRITGVTSTGFPGPVEDPQYNGPFFVTRVVSATRFQYQLDSYPIFPPTSAQAATYEVYSQTKRAVLESNCVDLCANTPNTLPNPQGCISVQGQNVRPTFPAWVVQDNLFRHTDGIPTNLTAGYFGGLSPAVRMTGLNGGVVQSNLIDLESPYPLQYLRTKLPPPNNPSSMNNTSMAGKLFRGGNFPFGGNAPDSIFDDLLTKIEDSLLFG